MAVDQDKLNAFLGTFVMDIGATMAAAFPNSAFVGSDYHAGSVEQARRRTTPGSAIG